MFIVDLSGSWPGHFIDTASDLLLTIPSRVDQCLGGSVEQADLAGGCWQHRWEVHARLVDDHGLAFLKDDFWSLNHFEYALCSDERRTAIIEGTISGFDGL